MAWARIQLFAFGLALSGGSGVLAATLLPNWKVHVDGGSGIITALVQMQGLWMDCTWYSTGMFSCALKFSILALPAHVQAARAAMVLACLLSALGICTSTVGMSCTRLGGDPKTKSHAAFAGGLCLLSAGLSGLIPTVWYTQEIIADFLDPMVPEGSKQEPGGALYVGFVGAALLLVSGLLFCASCLRMKPQAWVQAPGQPDSDPSYDRKDYV
ncbi:PREDICTED: claudin-20 [Elephantulus edwardii]|uniref:claudin-20 n=1 Tax=Elephantulus edwardii TaxID=28737 RepID=UPI0003F0E19B|nr:PREDICTED: claudin-20 [Elephantulus edwardii]